MSTSIQVAGALEPLIGRLLETSSKEMVEAADHQGNEVRNLGALRLANSV